MGICCYLKGFFITVVLISTTSALFGPCTIQPNGPMGEDNTYRMKVQNGCLNGTIDWNYPRGDLYVAFQTGERFSVCVTHGIGPLASAVYQVTDEGSVRIADPQQDEPTCIESTAGKAVIRFSQPSFQTYVINYNYRVEIKA